MRKRSKKGPTVVRQLPSVKDHVESGAVRFGNDLPGLFIAAHEVESFRSFVSKATTQLPGGKQGYGFWLLAMCSFSKVCEWCGSCKTKHTPLGPMGRYGYILACSNDKCEKSWAAEQRRTDAHWKKMQDDIDNAPTEQERKNALWRQQDYVMW